jgi:hypothetical protein
MHFDEYPAIQTKIKQTSSCGKNIVICRIFDGVFVATRLPKPARSLSCMPHLITYVLWIGCQMMVAQDYPIIRFLQAETYLGEKFIKAVPKEGGSKWKSLDGLTTPIKIEHLDHSAIEVTDVELSVK